VPEDVVVVGGGVGCLATAPPREGPRREELLGALRTEEPAA
jgi:hypothetical protein